MNNPYNEDDTYRRLIQVSPDEIYRRWYKWIMDHYDRRPFEDILEEGGWSKAEWDAHQKNI